MSVLKLTSDHTLAEAELLADRRVRRVLDVLTPAGEETRIVGGAVRNALLGLGPGDIDLATTLLPEAVQALARSARLRAIPTGIDHGTVTILVDRLPFEVTTLREDVATDGRHAVVRFGRDFGADARRRDFTINALSLSPDGRVSDTVGGVADLAVGRVRFIGDARTRLREDYLRILRFFRFHAAYGRGPLDPEGLAAAAQERDGLGRLSRERIRAETMKLLGSPQAGPPLHAMAQAGILHLVLGAEGDLGALDALTAREAAPDPLLRLAALSVRDGRDIERLRERLRLTNAEQRRLFEMLAAKADMEGLPDSASLRGLLFTHGLDPCADALTLGAALGPLDDGRAWSAALDELRSIPRPELPWSGRELKAGGLSGPEVGAGLAELRRRWMAHGFPDQPEALGRLFEAAVAAVRGRPPA